jgi:hypothetical protein
VAVTRAILSVYWRRRSNRATSPSTGIKTDANSEKSLVGQKYGEAR